MKKPKYKLGEKIDIHISFSLNDREEYGFNESTAFNWAYQEALQKFDCDDCGHVNNVQDSERSLDSLVVELVTVQRRGGMGGQSMHYNFIAWVERNNGEGQ